MSVVVNGAFRPQRVTGQQRYAREVADRLATRDGFVEARPTGWGLGSAVREWAWSLTALPRIAGDRTVLSLTSRAPVRRDQVLTVHDLFVLTDPQWFSRRYAVTHAPMLRAQLRAARAVVTVSDAVADEVTTLTDAPVVVAPPAPSEVFQRRDDDDGELLGRLGLAADGYLLTVASRDPRKNLPRLAEAWARVPERDRLATPLVVVGDGGGASFRRTTAAWPPGTRLLDYVSDDDLRRLYAGARAVVFPSLAEGFGLPIVEAAAAGARRVVVSDIPVFRWICGADAEYVDPGSVADLARGLEAALAAAGPTVALAHRFDWDRTVDVVADVCAPSR